MKINLNNYPSLLRVRANMKQIETELQNINLDKISSCSELSVDDQINNAIDKLELAVKEIKKYNKYEKIYGLYQKIFNEEKKKTPSHSSKSSLAEEERKKGGDRLKSNSASTYSSVSSKKKKTKKKKKKSKKVASLVAKIDAVPATETIAALTVNTLVQPTTDIRVDSYNKLEEMLKSGNITSEAGALYDTLKTFGMGNEADSLLEKYGYKVSKDENGNTVISKIEKEVEVPINNEDSNKSDSNQSSDIPKTD